MSVVVNCIAHFWYGVYNIVRYNAGSNIAGYTTTYPNGNAIYGAGTTLIISIDNAYNLICRTSFAGGIYTTHLTTNFKFIYY